MTATTPDARYRSAVRAHGAMMARLASSFERNPSQAEDLLQQIHVELWRSFAAFNGQCSEKSWVYRIAHNVAVSHVIRESRRADRQWVDLDELEIASDDAATASDDEERRVRLLALIHRLKPTDRQIMLLHLEELSAGEIADLLGLSANVVSVRLHRARHLLKSLYGDKDDQ